ncbi:MULTISPECIES: mercury(II) reductase [Halobacteriales]|mgnify:CR=1 FL=1|jgi:mercuric reductase|uniref:Mercuric reductase n=1 Tax=Halorubrum glutamatedens TaxID=2707018 RepID=A0ABD5QT10_9EURY|nr:MULTISPECIES: mercury(II) reductase [Haloferacaceae]RDZ56180.1 mercury(II) reductase [Haloferax sp. Atlit-10N]
MTHTSDYDLVILGGGAAAFAAITEASRRDLSTAIVNAGLPIGGTCVNVGCVPSKHLLAVAESGAAASENPFDAVTYPEAPTIDWADALDGTDELVERFRQQNYVDVAEHFETDIYEGYGQLVDSEGRSPSGNRNATRSGDDTTIEVVDGPDKGTRTTGEKALVATGSSPWAPPIDGLDDVDYYTSETILEERDLPESIVMLGGGYIALEWGQILHRVGVDVTILQRSERVLSDMEGQLAQELQRALHEEGIDIVTGNDFKRVRTAATDGSSQPSQQDVTVETVVDGEERAVTAEALFVATGVQPNSENIGLERVGVETEPDGAIRVDEYFQTTNPDIYAAGDVIGEPELETVAAKEGNHAVKNAFGSAELRSVGRSSGQSPREDYEGVTIDYDTVPAVVFTSPEVAAVGTTEREYMNKHGICSCRTVQMEDVPRAKAVSNTDGLVQVVKHHETDEIVGVHIVGPRAADMIMEATLAVKFGLTVDDIIDTVHPFPTFSEAFKQACQAFRRDTSKMSCCIE